MEVPMNNFFQLSTDPIMQAIGWTLVHSIWEAMLVMLFLQLLLRFIPSQYAFIRYAISLGSLAAIVLASLTTFYVVLPVHGGPAGNGVLLHSPTSTSPSAIRHLVMVQDVESFLQLHMPFILLIWMAGVSIFTVRLLGGWQYIIKLKRTAVPITDERAALTTVLGRRLGIARLLRIAESAHITAPAVIGYFKPLILVPIGMFTGLSREQVETVLLHELIHIRRHDFLINLLQSFMEVVFFFNPFVWIVSAIIRTEREYCCDDEVVKRYHPRIYAEALAHLEESRICRPGLVLSLSGNKINLLKRIERIMGTSLKNNAVLQWLVPVVLVVVGLGCASWLTIGSDPAQDEMIMQSANKKETAAKDTTDRSNEKEAYYSREKITTVDKNGQPHEDVIENFKGDEELRDMMDTDADKVFFLNIPMGFGDMTGDSSLLQSGDFGSSIPQVPLPDFDFDSFTPGFPPPAFHGKGWFAPDSVPGEDNWDSFQHEFEKMFEERFSDFYKEHQEDLNRMMEELDNKFRDFNESEEWRDMGKKLRDLTPERMDEVRMIRHEKTMKDAQEKLARMQTQLEMIHKRELDEMKRMEMKMRQKVDNQKPFFDAIREQLIRDHYLQENEKLESLNWSNNEIKVNGKRIKEKDIKKYQEIRDRFHHADDDRLRIVE
jgi:bla regulator protein blaR1